MRTALCNRLRVLVAEYGIVCPRGWQRYAGRPPELLEDADNGLSPLMRELLERGAAQLQEVDEHIEFYYCLIKRTEE